MKPWTEERLRALTTHDLQKLYTNARTSASAEADDIIELIFQHQLLDSIGGGLPRSHPTIVEIEKVCRSEQGIAAAEAASSTGEAAIAGVDPLLRVAVREYGYHDTTSWAGTFVAEQMESLGWQRQGRKALPDTCVAKTAAFFVKAEK